MENGKWLPDGAGNLHYFSDPPKKEDKDRGVLVKTGAVFVRVTYEDYMGGAYSTQDALVAEYFKNLLEGLLKN